MQALAKKSLFDDVILQECIDRIGKIKSDTQPIWGSMTAAQMMAHCAEIQEVANGKELKNTPFLAKLFKSMVKNMVINAKPYPKNSRTHPQYIKKTEHDFEMEKKRLIVSLRVAASAKDQDKTTRHQYFGKMTSADKGWSYYKHLDHHLGQFGV